MRARTASLQASPLAWLQATRTAKSFLGASQATANHMVLLPAWVRAGPPAQGWLSAIIQPMAYGGAPGGGGGRLSAGSGFAPFVFADGGVGAAELGPAPLGGGAAPAAGPWRRGSFRGGGKSSRA